jgi:decaprenylphospho-beta-D-ribofuranose 2-oxidase
MILAIYERLVRRKSRRRLALRPALFPIEGLEGYYAAFGSRGFREYQIIVPFAAWEPFVHAIEALLAEAPVPVTLGSLKLFDGVGRNLTFCGSGICLAIDAPATASAARLFAEIDRLAIDLGACVNLSKDSRISAELCRQLFPQYEAFRTALRAYDPEARCTSRLRTRVGV